jgi:uncharacterized protein (DUF427 family)
MADGMQPPAAEEQRSPAPVGVEALGIAPRPAVVAMDMSAGHSITISSSDSHVEVRLAGQLLATSDHPVLLHETGLPARYYLPREDVLLELLRPTSFHTTCPFKGEASYWSIDIDGQTHDGIVWSYETPLPAAGGIKGMMAFYPDRVDVTVDGQLVNA